MGRDGGEAGGWGRQGVDCMKMKAVLVLCVRVWGGGGGGCVRLRVAEKATDRIGE